MAQIKAPLNTNAPILQQPHKHRGYVALGWASRSTTAEKRMMMKILMTTLTPTTSWRKQQRQQKQPGEVGLYLSTQVLKMGFLLGVQIKAECGGRRRGSLVGCMPTSPPYMNIDLECFCEPVQPGCAGCTLYLQKAKVQGVVSWFVSCSCCGKSNCLYLHISAGSHSVCVWRGWCELS